MYEATLQSQMLSERRPLTIVSLAIKFHAAMMELGTELHPATPDFMESLTIKQDLLATVIEEYNSHCVNPLYKLSSVQQDCIKHCLLHSSPSFLRLVGILLDSIPEKVSPYKLKILQTKRWLIGGSSAKANDQSIWATMLLMDAQKQTLLGEIVNHEALQFHMTTKMSLGL